MTGQYSSSECIKRPVFRAFLSLTATLVAVFLAACIHDKEEENLYELSEGQSMPQFEVVTTAGDTVSTASLHGYPSVIIFFSTTCPDCRRQLPMLQEIYDSTGDDGVKWICIARKEMSVTPFWEEYHLTMPVSPQPDRKVYDLFAASGIPRAFIFDRAGMLYASFGGLVDIDIAAFTASLDNLIQ